MIKDIYPVSKIPFEELLLKNNYKLNEETFKIFINDKYCIHRIKSKKGNSDEYIPCRRKKKEGQDFCGRHAPINVSFINKCIYNNCRKTTKKDKICFIHKKYLNKICNISLPIPDDEEIIFFGHKIYNCRINGNTKIIIKDYIFDGHFSDNKKNNLIKYNYFSFNSFLYDIYNKYKTLILSIINKYNINITFLYNLLKIIYDEFNKMDKKVSVLSNSNTVSKKKKKKNKKINNINFSNIFEEVKQYRNKIIIENNLDILVMKDEDFIINNIFKACLSYFNDKTEINKIYDNMLNLSIKLNIIPVDDNTDKILSLEEYIHKIKNTNFDIKKYKEDIIYIEKYLEFVFKSYNLAYYNKTIIKDLYYEIINNFIENNSNSKIKLNTRTI